MIELISPLQAKTLLDKENALLIDVRETEEYAMATIPGARLQPLSVIERLPVDDDPERPVLYFCNSGNRTAAAQKTLAARGHVRAYGIDGGMEAWEKAGLPVQRHKGAPPVSRQVHIAAGALIVLFILIGKKIPFFLIIPFFIGVGLLASGLTGACGMAAVLKKMPWNKND